MTIAQTEFQKFLQQAINERNMSMREFAVLMGVSHPTISRLLDPREPVMPTLEFLFKLSEATNADVCELVRMVAPSHLGISRKPSAWALAIAERVERLSPEVRQIMDDFLLTAVLRSRQKPEIPDKERGVE